MLALVFAAGPAAADSPFGAGDVVEFMMRADRDCPGLGCPPDWFAGGAILGKGVVRSACVGRAVECVGGDATAEKGVASLILNLDFPTNSAVLADTAVLQLETLAAALADPALAGMRFGIVAHTDGQGDAELNRTLSRLRAAAVREFLIARGIAGNRLVIEGRGEDEPLFPQNPDAPLNRRIEVRVLR